MSIKTEQRRRFAGRYEAGAPIGAGAFGAVYSALDMETGDHVAIKVLKPAAAADREQLARFRREGEIGQLLSHPNITKVIDVGEAKGSPYIAFELVAGAPLGQLVNFRRRLRIEEVVGVLGQVLDALQYAHMTGVVHRDLKPDNILLVVPPQYRTPMKATAKGLERLGLPNSEDPMWYDVGNFTVKIIDFGMGKLLPHSGIKTKRLTRAGYFAGTPEYMSPEQIRSGHDVDHRTDLYSCAMLMYRMLSGEPPYRQGTPNERAQRQLDEPIPALPTDDDNLWLDPVYRRAGCKKPSDRYGSAAQMAWALNGCLEGGNTGMPEPDASELLAKTRRRLIRRITRK